MTEEEAREQVRALTGDAAVARLDRLAALVLDENTRQNLIAPSTMTAIWSRHIFDSVQLLRFAVGINGAWLDVGTGGGFPGLALAAALDRLFVLVEPRRRRSEFLSYAVGLMELTNVAVRASKIEHVDNVTAGVISARAVGSVPNLFATCIRCSTWNTRWILPRGSSASADLHTAQSSWQGDFRMEPSITDPASQIFIATHVSPR